MEYVPRGTWVVGKGDTQGPKLDYLVVQSVFWGPGDGRAAAFVFGLEHVGCEGGINVVQLLDILRVELIFRDGK